jgi:hypothetical protein
MFILCIPRINSTFFLSFNHHLSRREKILLVRDVKIKDSFRDMGQDGRYSFSSGLECERDQTHMDTNGLHDILKSNQQT